MHNHLNHPFNFSIIDGFDFFTLELDCFCLDEVEVGLFDFDFDVLAAAGFFFGFGLGVVFLVSCWTGCAIGTYDDNKSVHDSLTVPSAMFRILAAIGEA